jgi:capsular polysaccharide biosynthesis protein
MATADFHLPSDQKTSREFHPPSRWYRRGKYLLPLDGRSWFGWPASAPHRHASLAQLAADDPDRVALQTSGAAEHLSESTYGCFQRGQNTRQVLPSQQFAPAFVARLKGGRSFGRHCCVIAPSGEAVREAGYGVPGVEREHTESFSPLSARYWRKRWQGDVTSRFWLPSLQKLTGRVAVLNTQHSHNFYHWMCDIAARLSSLRRLGLEADYYLVDCLASYQQQALTALGIVPSQRIQPHCRLLLEAEELLVPSWPTPTCWRHFGGWLSESLQANEPAASRRIYISRRKTGIRGIMNEAELQSLLNRFDFQTHSFEEYPLARQAQLVRQAELIVAPHGAGLANLLFAQPGTQVIEIFPEQRNNPLLFPRLSRALGLHHQQVLAPITGPKQMLDCPLDDLQSALDQAIQQTQSFG